MAEPPKHHIGYVDSFKLTTSLCLTYTVGVAFLRVWVRRSSIGSDDIVISIATIVCLGHFASNYLALEYGAGKPWDSITNGGGNVESLNDSSIAGVVTFATSLYLSKCAMVAFLMRITKNKTWLVIYWVCLGTIVVFGIASVLVVTISWPLKSGYYWAFTLNQEPSDSQMTRWYIFTAFDIIAEVILLVLPIHLVWGLQMPLKKKATIIGAFYLRLPVIGISIGRLVYTQRLCDHKVDVGLGSTLVLIWLEIETSYAIVSNTLSAMKGFTMKFNSSFGLGFTTNANEGDYYGLSRVTKNSQTASVAKDSRPEISRSAPSESTLKHEVVVQSTELPAHVDSRASSPAIRLQPNPTRNYAQISSKPGMGSQEQRWREYRSSSSERTMEDGVIVKETEYSVQHQDMNDELPILSRPSNVRMYSRPYERR